jgi:heterotetrameric sarcosine oxidase gamma subunit
MTPVTGQAMFRLALWDDGAREAVEAALGARLPPPCRATSGGVLRLLWLESGHWLVTCPAASADAVEDRVEAALADTGTIVEVSAALAGRQLHGTGWRDLLMIGGVFDAEDPGFAPGCVARTVMHHASLLIDVVTDTHANAYVPASHAAEFFGFWEAAIRR